MLEILTSIKVKENDGLPKYSCSKCAQDVKSALITKRRIIRAHKLLVESLRKKKDQFDQRIKQVLGDNTIMIVEDDEEAVPSAHTSNIIFSNSRKPSNPHKPIEFVNVSPADSDVKQAIEKVNSNSGVTLTKVKQEKSLQQVIDEVVAKANKTYKCEICNITFPDKSTYSTHSGKHKKTKCEMCGIVIRSDNFKKHLMLHNSGPSTCDICGAICKNIESLRGHIFYQHKSSANEYVCEECGKHFRIKYKFELHKKKEHTGVRNFKCETCGKAFFTNGNLTTHVNMTHKKLRPHICEFCGTGFSSSYALKTHKRQHTNEKPFTCEFCPESFRQKVSLRSHLKSKHNVEESKEHFCKVCDKGFATSYALSIHARLHMAQKCEVCSESFADSEYLTNHLKDVHNITAVIENEGEEQFEEPTQTNVKSEVVVKSEKLL
ncbi:hypothetical protein NQ315_007784 [Exocentrus adspersus]|uniref:Uncharacterized protein n=1 Tax=Exocentrus adspersus TaxID=1586481 RepID=A0AAV8W8B9_9CUCU|nr:hypothetical protein NQ315_007784 [Exocentrus adspersus]